MARRRGKMGDHLATDDYSGATRYASELRKDYWGFYSTKPLKRNLQEIAKPLNDPGLVEIYRGPQYEVADPCSFEVAPRFVGNTTVPTNTNNAAFYALGLDPGIGDMAIGCTFIIR